jgi:hypothetical protein
MCTQNYYGLLHHFSSSLFRSFESCNCFSFHLDFLLLNFFKQFIYFWFEGVQNLGNGSFHFIYSNRLFDHNFNTLELFLNKREIVEFASANDLNHYDLLNRNVTEVLAYFDNGSCYYQFSNDFQSLSGIFIAILQNSLVNICCHSVYNLYIT